MGQAAKMWRRSHTRRMAGPPTLVSTSPSFRIPISSELTCWKHAGQHNQPGDAAQPTSSEIPDMIGDFDDSANTFWSLHMKEARGRDKARIESLKDDMEGILLFVRVIFYYHFPHRADAPSSRLVYSPRLSCPLLSISLTSLKSIQQSRWSSTSSRMLPCSLRSLPRSRIFCRPRQRLLVHESRV